MVIVDNVISVISDGFVISDGNVINEDNEANVFFVVIEYNVISEYSVHRTETPKQKSADHQFQFLQQRVADHTTFKINSMNISNRKAFAMVLADWQIDALGSSSGHLSKYDCLMSIIRSTPIYPTKYTKKEFSINLTTGQVALSEVELAEKWHCNRKTASKMIDLFNKLGLIYSAQGNRTSVHTILCVEHFTFNGVPISNPYYKKPLPQCPFEVGKEK